MSDDASSESGDSTPTDEVSLPAESESRDRETGTDAAGESGPADLAVPEDPPDPAECEHVLAPEQLCYPTFEFESGEFTEAGGFALSRALDRATARDWLDDLAGGLTSHDVAVRTPGGVGVMGVGTPNFSMRFDPNEEGRGDLVVELRMPASMLAFSSDPAVPFAGARGGRGFIPLAMLTGERAHDEFRCYNWLDQPYRPEDVDGERVGTATSAESDGGDEPTDEHEPPE